MNTFLKTISNTNRIKLILCLRSGSKNVTELLHTCNLSQSALSQHLTKLRYAGIVKSISKGRNQYYQLTDKKIAVLAQKIYSYLLTIEK